MSEQQIKDYLKKFAIFTKEDLATHIEQLKRNTKPNTRLISELVWVLDDFYFNFLPTEKTEKPQKNLNNHISEVLDIPCFLDEILYVNDIENSKFSEFKKTYYTLFAEELTGKKLLSDESINTPFFLDEVIQESEISAEKTKTEENIVFPQDSEIHKEEGIKTNKNKHQMSLLFKQFPEALKAIVKCSEYGHNKYKETDSDFLNFKRVEGGSKTYADAGLRHRLEQGKDLESNLPHQYHVAWNALAELELWIQEKE